MNDRPVIEIHPYDFLEMMEAASGVLVLTAIGSREHNLFEIDGKIYHRSGLAPRTDGPHTVF